MGAVHFLSFPCLGAQFDQECFKAPPKALRPLGAPQIPQGPMRRQHHPESAFPPPPASLSSFFKGWRAGSHCLPTKESQGAHSTSPPQRSPAGPRGGVQSSCAPAVQTAHSCPGEWGRAEDGPGPTLILPIKAHRGPQAAWAQTAGSLHTGVLEEKGGPTALRQGVQPTLWELSESQVAWHCRTVLHWVPSGSHYGQAECSSTSGSRLACQAYRGQAGPPAAGMAHEQGGQVPPEQRFPALPQENPFPLQKLLGKAQAPQGGQLPVDPGQENPHRSQTPLGDPGKA